MALQLAQIHRKPQIKDGPATRTRSKLAAKAANSAPPATRTRSKKKSKLQQPTKVPNHLHPTKSSAAKTTRQGIAHFVQEMCNNKKKLKKVHKKITKLENEVNQALAVMDKETGKMLNYRNLIRLPKYKELWSQSSANEFGRLANGVGGRIKNPTNTIKFIMEHEVPKQRKKDATYGQLDNSFAQSALRRKRKNEPVLQ